MEASDLKQKTDKELGALLETKRRELWSFRFGSSGGKAKNVKEGKSLRRDIARIMTVLSGIKNAANK